MARQGVDVTVIDKRRSASGLSRAVGILPRSLELLEPSGITPELLEQGITEAEYDAYLINIGEGEQFGMAGLQPSPDWIVCTLSGSLMRTMMPEPGRPGVPPISR